MDLEKFLISCFILVVAAFSYPGLMTATEGLSGSEPLHPLITIIPTILIVLTAIFPVYFGLVEK